MKAAVLSVSFALVSFPLLIASPAEVLLDGETTCFELGGDWDGAGGCLVSRFFLPYQIKLVIAEGVTLTMADRCDLGGEVTNYGTLVVVGLTVNGNVVRNRNLVINRGWIHLHHDIVNEAIFENEGFLDVCSGTMVNQAYLHNAGSIDSWGRVVNEGLLVNDGDIYNPDLGFVGIVNWGAVANHGFVDNEGIILCGCGAAWYGEGRVRGNSPEFEACDIAAAIQRLRDESMALGPWARNLLSKQQVISLLIPLDRAAKWALAGRQDRADIFLESFMERVEELVDQGELPFYVGEAFVARAAVLVGNPCG